MDLIKIFFYHCDNLSSVLLHRSNVPRVSSSVDLTVNVLNAFVCTV